MIYPIRMGIWLFCLFWLGYPQTGKGQVANDRIENRIRLRSHEVPFHSNTSGCTVEWKCVDERLTGQCIEYHNDQWFEFTPFRTGNYFINISRQACRDIRGVQLVVLEGVPCQPATYRILSCTSLATQDDIFVSLDSLQANHAYLLNIDGYLNDFCQFDIQVSNRPKGLPIRATLPKARLDEQLSEKAVQLNWLVTDSLGANLVEYRIYRRYEKEKKAKLMEELPHERNTRGESLLQYEMSDTVSEAGTYFYQVVGMQNDSTLVWITGKTIRYLPDAAQPEDFLILRLQYALNTPLTVLIFDGTTERLLKKIDFTFQRKGRPWRYNVGQWRDQGIYRFKVKVTDQIRKTSQEYSFNTTTP